eukprot:gene29466-35566_t
MDLSQFAFDGCAAGNNKASSSSDVIDLTQSPQLKRPLDELLGLVGSMAKKKKKKPGVSGVSNLPNKEHSATEAKGLGELYCTPGTEETRLKLVIVGHNPSHQAWTKGHYYANPSNRMWPLLRRAGIVPETFTADCDQLCPSICGVGFTDVMVGVGETDSSQFTDDALRACAAPFFRRLAAHCRRVLANQRNKGKRCSDISTSDAIPGEMASGARNYGHGEADEVTTTGVSDASHGDVAACAPLVLAFAGVRQWRCLFPPSATWETRFGLQTARPPGWPAELSECRVFLLPSSSGAAAMTAQQREEPYMQLGALLRELDGKREA